MSTTFDVYLRTKQLPSFAAIIDCSTRELHRFLELVGLCRGAPAREHGRSSACVGDIDRGKVGSIDFGVVGPTRVTKEFQRSQTSRCGAWHGRDASERVSEAGAARLLKGASDVKRAVRVAQRVAS
jgi:hypothetical protein